MGNWSTLSSIIWFLPTLFSLNLLFFIFNKSNKLFKYSLITLSFCSFLFASELVEYHYNIPFGIDVAMYLFLVSFLIKLIYENKEIILNKINYFTLLLVLVLSSMLLFIYEPLKTHTQWHSIIDFAQFSVATTYIGYLSFVILNICIFVFFLKLKANKYFQYIGIYSFPIFLLHLIILYRLPNYISFENSTFSVLFLIVALIASIFLPIIISKILMKISNKFKYIGMIQ